VRWLRPGLVLGLVLLTALPALATDTVGVVDPATGNWTLRSENTNTKTIVYGNPGDVPFMGDWNCDGVDTPGLYRRSDGFAYLSNRNTTGVADVTFVFGNPGDLPLAGDFDGDGCDTLSIYRPSEARFYVINQLGLDGGGLGAADFFFDFGNPGDIPVIGDWEGDGTDSPGLRRPSDGFVYFRNSNSTGIADISYFYGDPGDLPVAGDWNDDGADTFGLFRPSNRTFFLKNTNGTGVADASFALGPRSAMPVSGDFNLNLPPPSVGGGFGAGAVGPGQETRTTQGVLVEGPAFASSIESARTGAIVLLRGGTYSGGFQIPSGVTVKPYNGESVIITGSVTMNSRSVLAGVDLRSSGQWAIRVDSPSDAKSDVTIRNNVITGGSVETIRVSRNVSGVLITGNDISGGGNHAIKVHGEGSGHSPSATISGNRIHDPSREDAIQTEDNGSVTIDRNTFYGTPENAIDVKTGQVVAITNNLFEGSSLIAEALLVHGDGVAVAVHNWFAEGADIGLGSSSSGNPTMTLRENRVDGGDIVIRRSSQPIVIEDNVVNGGTLKLGIAGGDHPTDATVTGNVFEGTELLDRVTPSGDSWACSANTLIEVIGDWSGCT
jgi:Right handed beta helix region